MAISGSSAWLCLHQVDELLLCYDTRTSESRETGAKPNRHPRRPLWQAPREVQLQQQNACMRGGLGDRCLYLFTIAENGSNGGSSQTGYNPYDLTACNTHSLIASLHFNHVNPPLIYPVENKQCAVNQRPSGGK